jgi:hypothetical protein
MIDDDRVSESWEGPAKPGGADMVRFSVRA